MALTQKYGITYPFSSENLDEVYMDLNKTRADGIKSQLLHLIFTPKGQKLMDPNFGTGLIGFIFSPNDDITIEAIKEEISKQITKYVPGVLFRNIEIYQSEENTMVVIEYSTSKGTQEEITKVAVKI